jgi:hypothetical protein
MPWIKNPVCYIEDNKIFVVYDSYKTPKQVKNEQDKDEMPMHILYIKTPNKFAKDLNKYATPGTWSWFDPANSPGTSDPTH